MNIEVSKKLKELIFEYVHREFSSDIARTYFTLYKIDMHKINETDCADLIKFISKETTVLHNDGYYKMVTKLAMKNEVDFTGDKILLSTSALYFSEREAISFDLHDYHVSFCD